MPEVPLPSGTKGGAIDVVDLLVSAKLAKTKNEARRLLRQGGVKLNGTPLTTSSFPAEQGAGAVLQVGSRRFRKLARKGSKAGTSRRRAEA